VALTHDAATSNSGTADFDISHTANASANFGIVLISQFSSVTEQMVKVTWGGTEMMRMFTENQDADSEDGRWYIYVLENPPTGSVTVSIDMSSTTSKHATAISLIASGGRPFISDADWFDQVDALASTNYGPTLTTGGDSLCYGIAQTTLNSPGNITPEGSLTQIVEFDHGAGVCNVSRKNVTGAGSPAVQWQNSAGSGGLGGFALAIEEEDIAPAGDVFLEDTFTDTSGDSVDTQHTPETGDWGLRTSGSWTTLVVSDANRARGTGSFFATQANKLTTDPDPDDYELDMIGQCITDESAVGWFFRDQDPTDTAYFVRWSGLALDLIERTAGSEATLVAVSEANCFGVTPAVNWRFHLRVRVDGSAITVYLNYRKLIDTTDATITGGGLTMITQAGVGTTSNTVGNHIDYVKGTYLEADAPAFTVRNLATLGVG
jgi:hypothetical protein